VQRYPKLSHILPYLREPSNGRTVEEVLESLQDEAAEFPERLRELASVQFYLRDLLFEVSGQWRDATSGVTNYSPLIGEILRHNNGAEPVCLVSFNYDLLLDRALKSFDYKPQKPADQFRAHPLLKLFKPHGSVDWARYVYAPDGLSPEQLIEQAESIQLSSEFERVGNMDEANALSRNRTVFPAIAIPFQNKTKNTFACPSSHLTYLQQLLANVTKILIIGWQAKEAHFLQLLQSGLRGVTDLMVVGSDTADSERVLQFFANQIAKALHTRFKSYKGQGGFSKFVVNREGEAFLKV
jgi:hypothetical protein